ncbi:MAG TPA: DNA-directed RNA polymerase subunit omega [Pyrinomonadaceae bacterium]|nr:DNA-directed RNA polymerase subunit omega [Pyrinomonadaceae bacterium]
MKKAFMTEQNNHNGHRPAGAAYEGTWPGIDSRFRLIIVASLRSKQLVAGSKPRIEVDKGRRRNTSIALEEVKRGLVAFTNVVKTPTDQISKAQGTA